MLCIRDHAEEACTLSSAARVVIGLCIAQAVGCQSRLAHSPKGASCDEDKRQLTSALSQMPEVAARAAFAVTLPSAALEGGIADGDVLELSASLVRLNGSPLLGSGTRAKVEALADALQADDVSAASDNKHLYLAVAEDVNIRFLHDFLRVIPQDRDLRLVFARPPLADSAGGPAESLEPAERLLLEADPSERESIASQGYQQYSACEPLLQAVQSVNGTPPQERWLRLRPAVSSVLARCDCQTLDGEGLIRLLHAERRAGDVAFGSVTGNFLRDVRCRASIPLQSSGQVLRDIVRFDQEFSGDWEQDELVFSTVVTDERLLNYLCPAMPGEVLEAEARAVRSIYLKSDSGTCQEWAIEPIARGAPLGTFRSVKDERLAFHYRIGGNQVQILGPANSAAESITSGGPWQCNEMVHLNDVTSTYLGLTGGGRWFFERAACRRSDAQGAAFSGCLSEVLNGRTPKPLAQRNDVEPLAP